MTTTKLERADAQALLSNADQALYEAKRAGRNQVVTAQAELPRTEVNGTTISADRK